MMLTTGAELPFRGVMKRNRDKQPIEKKENSPHNRIAELFKKVESEGGTFVAPKTSFNLGNTRQESAESHFAVTPDFQQVKYFVDLDNDSDDDRYDGPVIFLLHNGQKFYSDKSAGKIEAYELDTPLDLFAIRTIYRGTK